MCIRDSYKTVVKNVAAQNGLFATFMPKPLENQFGSGLHIGIAIKKNGKHIFLSLIHILNKKSLENQGIFYI